MKETRVLMGMPITVEIIEGNTPQDAIDKVFAYFTYVDQTFSTYKTDSEISKINNGLLGKKDWSKDMQEVVLLCDRTKQETNGYFDIVTNTGASDPSGLVKGWAIFNAADLLKKLGFSHFYIEAGGDIQVQGANREGKPWSIGIKNPFNPAEIIKTIYLKNNEGVATSGSYERGGHIYNPKSRTEILNSLVSLTVIGKNVYEADRFATAAFAMSGSRGIEGQQEGINFIEKLAGFEGYAIDNKGIATMTSGFENFVSL